VASLRHAAGRSRASPAGTAAGPGRGAGPRSAPTRAARRSRPQRGVDARVTCPALPVPTHGELRGSAGEIGGKRRVHGSLFILPARPRHRRVQWHWLRAGQAIRGQRVRHRRRRGRSDLRRRSKAQTLGAETDVVRVDVHVRCTVHLAKYVVRDVLDRGEGPQSFALALLNEPRDTGVTVMSRMPARARRRSSSARTCSPQRSGPATARTARPTSPATASMAAKEPVVASSLSTKQARGSRFCPTTRRRARIGASPSPVPASKVRTLTSAAVAAVVGDHPSSMTDPRSAGPVQAERRVTQPQDSRRTRVVRDGVRVRPLEPPAPVPPRRARLGPIAAEVAAPPAADRRLRGCCRRCPR
jgi:hypothetical protein